MNNFQSNLLDTLIGLCEIGPRNRVLEEVECVKYEDRILCIVLTTEKCAD